MGLFTDKFKEPILGLGIIVLADPKANSYVIQPLNEVDDRDAQLAAVPASIGGARSGIVTDTVVYELGDHVVYIYPEESLWGYSPLRVALILCRLPYDSLGWVYEPTSPSEVDGPRDYYDKVKALAEQPADKLANFSSNKYENERIGGDRILEGDNTLLRISDELVELHSGNGRLILNGVDSSVTQTSVTRKVASIPRITEEHLINDSTLRVVKEFFSTDRGFSSESRKPDKITLTGDLVYGEVSAIINSDNQPISVIERRSDGGYRHTALKGPLFEQTPNIKLKIPKYQTSIDYDEGLSAVKPNEYREAFDRVSNSPNWVSLISRNSTTDIRQPGDIDNSQERLTDVEGGAVVTTHVGKASMGFLPSGGFIIRDAWGSELRLENGDIQLSAARNLISLPGKDELHICGGVFSLVAADIDIGSTKGNVDIQANDDVNIHARENLTIQSDRELNINGKTGTNILSASGGVSLYADNLVLTGNQEITVTTDKLYMFGATEMLAATTVSAIHCADNGVTIGGSTVSVKGDMQVSKQGYAPGKIGNTKIQTPTTTGGLDVEGAFYCKESISTDRTVLANGLLAGLSVHVTEADPKIGVYKTNNRPKKLNKIFPSSRQSETVINKLSNKLLESVKKLSPRDLLSSMFTLSDNVAKVIRPMFSGKHNNDTPIKSLPAIDTGSPKRYIYPGENFWFSNGCVTIDPKKSANNVQGERAEGTSYEGIDSLQLHNRKG